MILWSWTWSPAERLYNKDCVMILVITSVYPPRPEGHTEYRTAIAPLDAGAIYAGDMTAAAALTKFSWVLAQVDESLKADDADNRLQLVRSMMERNFIGERGGSPEQALVKV